VEKQAAEQLGEAIIAGSIISTSGTGRAMAMNVAGAYLGGAIGSGIASAVNGATASKREITTPAGYEGLLYIGVGSTKVGFFRVQKGLMGPGLKELLLTTPRESIASFELGGGMVTCPLKIGLSDGTLFALEVPRAHKGKAEKVGALLAH
jgi:hypothetical protein